MEVSMELSSRQIQDRDFSTARRGYDRGEVDGFLNECATLTSALEQRTRIAEVRAESSELELAKLQSNIDVLLQEATDARRKIIDEARAEASSIATQTEASDGSQELSDAASKATAIVSEAENKARLRMEESDQIREAARDDAGGIIMRAEQSAAMTQAEADRLLDKARLDANSIREETRAIQVSMEAQLAEIRRLLAAARVGDADADLVIDLREGADTPQSHGSAG
jgi:DivIVA domain-containing protein